MDSIKLDDLLTDFFHHSGAMTESNAFNEINQTRAREMRMRSILPARLIRRLDKGFARSNTVHPETGYALYKICRACNAKIVFETGTYYGFSTAYLAAALKDSHGGRVHTFDIYPHAGKHIPKALLPYVELHRGKPSSDTMPPVLRANSPDIFFQDSRHDYEGVKEELETIVSYLRPRAIILFHDFIENQVRNAAQEILTNYTFFVIETSDPQQLGIGINNEFVANPGNSQLQAGNKP